MTGGRRRTLASEMQSETRSKKELLFEIDNLRFQLTEAQNAVLSLRRRKSNGIAPGGHVTSFADNLHPQKGLERHLVSCANAKENSEAESCLRFYQQILSGTRESIAIHDADGRIIEQNAAHRALLGYPDEELLGKTAAYFMEGGKDESGGTMESLLKWASYSGEARCRAKSGKWVDVELSALILRDDAGEISGYATFMKDVTRSKSVQEALQESEERFAAFMNHSSVVAFLRDDKGRYVFVNRAFEKYVGRPSSDVMDKTVFDIWPVEIAKDLSSTDKRVLAMGQPMELYERTVLAGQEAREWLAIKFPFRDRKGRNYVGGVSIDVTERKNLGEQLRQSQKMEAVGRLAGGVAHDFNNLLTIIMGYCDLLLRESLIDANQRGKIEEIKKAGERAAILTRQLLAFSRKQVLAPRVLDLNTVVENLRKMIERLIGEDVEFSTIPHAHLNLVKADPGQVEQIIMNLVVNARDAMPSGGKLTIETANIEFDESHGHSHPPGVTGHYVMIAVSDTGTGMDRETQKHIFEPFFTTKEPGKGTGLGLATVYGIVKQSEGFMRVCSEVGVGSTFKIYFPCVLEGQQPPLTNRLEPDELIGTETVLVAEDEDSLRLLIRETLERYGYNVLEAANAEKVFSLSSQYLGPIHLLVTDVVMPQMSGCEVAARVALARPGVRVLYISGYSDDAIVRHEVLDPSGAFLQKPFSPYALGVKVRQVLSQFADPKS